MSDLELTMMKRVGELKAELTACKAEADRLKAEVVQLIQGGDELLEIIDCNYCPEKVLAHKVWRAAKAKKL